MEHRGRDDRGLEAVGLRDEGEDAVGAVALSHDREPVRVRIALVDRRVDAGHDRAHEVFHRHASRMGASGARTAYPRVARMWQLKVARLQKPKRFSIREP